MRTCARAGRGGDWGRPRRLRGSHKGRVVGHVGGVRGRPGEAGWHVSQRGLHPFQGTLQRWPAVRCTDDSWLSRGGCCFGGAGEIMWAGELRVVLTL